MISRADIDDRVREWGITEEVVEKDYVLGWLLWGIGTEPRLESQWIFKGGTCLKKCYLETYRFSEDLDFTVLPEGPVEPDEVRPILQELLRRVGDESGIDFGTVEPFLKVRTSTKNTEVRVYYRGPRKAPNEARVKLDLNGTEKVVRPMVLRNISHPHADVLPPPGQIRCYSFEEVFGEKLRAMGERSLPRDLYDIVNLYRRRDLQMHPEVIRKVLVEKCETKGVPIPTAPAILQSPHRAELESEWANMLLHQLPALPPFEEFLAVLTPLFEWLEGKAGPEPLPILPMDQNEDLWTPPATMWTWGQGVALEPVRFAAVNHLCVELEYKGTKRLIEPYSLRRTREGHLLLHARRVDNQRHRAYRVDQIVSLRVTTRPFKPIYAIEFAPSGGFTAPPTRR